MKDDYAHSIKSITDSLNQKADRDELAELEARIMEKLNEMLKKLLQQFADNKETKKRFSNVEKNIKNLYDLLMNRTMGPMGGHGNEEDAMFTKKPLGGLSCASCERNI